MAVAPFRDDTIVHFVIPIKVTVLQDVTSISDEKANPSLFSLTLTPGVSVTVALNDSECGW